MIQRTPAPRTSFMLCSLALLLALHPLSGSDRGNGEGLAAMLKALLCGCETCDEVAAPAAPETLSCCDEEPVDDDCGGTCPCSHPADVPLPASTPLFAGPRAGIDGTVPAFVAQCAALSAATPVPFIDTVVRGSAHAPPGGRPPLRPVRVAAGAGTALGVADGPRTRLAVLCIALL